MPEDFELIPILCLLLIILCSTFVPFFISWIIKMRCNDRHLAFRFISRKWIITVIPCAMTLYVITLHHEHLGAKLISYIVIWAAISSGLFLLGEHISQLLSKLYSIKYKDVNVIFDQATGHIHLAEKQVNSDEDKNGKR